MERRWVVILYYIVTFILGFNIVAPIFVDKKGTVIAPQPVEMIADSPKSTYVWSGLALGNQLDMIRLGSSEYYLHVANGTATKGYAIVLQVFDSNGTIRQTPISRYNFSGSGGHPAICTVNSEEGLYAVSYRNKTTDRCMVQILQVWDTNGTIRQQRMQRINLTQDGDQTDIIKANGNTYVVAYCEDGTGITAGSLDGWIETLYIHQDGNIAGLNNSWEFDASTGSFPQMISLDSDTIAIVYTGTTSYGWLVTYNISDSGVIGDTSTLNRYAKQWQFNGAVIGNTPYIINLSVPKRYAIAYAGASSDGFVGSLYIDDDGIIRKTLNSTFEYDEADGAYPYLFRVDNNCLGITWRGSSADGWTGTIGLDRTGYVFTTIFDRMEFNIANSIYRAPACRVSDQYYFSSYVGTTSYGNSFVSNISHESNFIIYDENDGTLAGTPTAYSNGRKIVRNSTGALFSVYYRARTSGAVNNIMCGVSVDNGITWKNYSVTKNTRAQLYPSIAIDSTGKLHVVWQAYHNGSTAVYQIRYCNSSDGGVTWSQPVNLTKHATYNQYVPSITVGSNDSLYVVWHGNHALATDTYNYQVRTSRSFDKGKTWSQSINVTTKTMKTRIQSYPTIEIDNNDILHCVWYGNDTQNRRTQVRYSNSYDSGVTWSQYVNISKNISSRQYEANLAIDGENNLYVVWRGNQTATSVISQIRFSRSVDGGETWSQPINFTDSAVASMFQYQPSISLDREGNLYVVWYGAVTIGTGSTTQTYLRFSKSTNLGTTWSIPVNLTYGGNSVTETNYPSLLFSTFPNVSDLQWNRPATGYVFVYGMESTYVCYDRNSTLVWDTKPRKDKQQGFYNISFRSIDLWEEINGGNSKISGYPEMDYDNFWSLLLYNTTYTFMVRESGSIMHDLTEQLRISYIQNGPVSKLTYNVNCPYQSDFYFLNLTIGTPLISYVYDEQHHNITLEFFDEHPYFVNYNYSDISEIPGVYFTPSFENGRFSFSIVFPIVLTGPRSLDPTVTISVGTSLSSAYSSQRKMSRTSNGVLYMAQVISTGSPAGNQITLVESLDNGSTWSPYKYQVTPNSTGKRNQTYPSIAINSNDEIYITWIGQLQGYNSYFMRFRKFYLSNRSFSTKIINVSRISTASYPSSVVDSNNNVFVGWSVNSSVYLRKYWYLNNSFGSNYFNVTTGTWTDSGFPIVMVDSSNNLYVMFYGVAGSSYYTQRRFWQTNMSLSTKLVNFSIASGKFTFSSLIDKDGNIDVVFPVYKTGAILDLRYKKYWSLNNSWNPVSTNITKDPTYSQNSPTIGLNGTNDLYVLWIGAHNGSITNSRLRSSNYTVSTNTWSQPTNWTKGATGRCYNPSVIYAWYPSVSGAQTNIPTRGLCGFYVNGTTTCYVNSSRVDWGVPSVGGWKEQGFFNISFSHIQGNENQGYLNVSFKNSPFVRNFGFWNASFRNTTLPPIITNEDPVNESTGILPPTKTSVTVDDPDNDKVNVTWYWNETSYPAFLTGWNNDADNPLKDLDDGAGGGQGWLAGCYNSYDDKIYLYIQDSEGGSYISDTIECFSFTLDNASEPANWTFTDDVYQGTHAWDNMHIEPHGLIFETQALADARTSGPATPCWRLYYCGIADGEDSTGYDSGFILFENDSMLTPIYYGAVYNNTAFGYADPEVVIYKDQVWMLIVEYNTYITKFVVSDDGITGWTNHSTGVFWDKNAIGTISLCGTGILIQGNSAYSFTNYYWGNWTDDGEECTDYAGNPVLSSGAVGTWNDGLIWNTIVVDETGFSDLNGSGVHYMYYVGREDLAEDNISLGLATTSTVTLQGESSWVEYGTNLSVDTSGGLVTLSQPNINFTGNSKTYWWKVVVNDGMGGHTNETYTFQTNATNGTRSQRNLGFWNISFSNTLSYENRGFWNISFSNTLSYKAQGFWNVSFKSTLSQKNQGFWNLSFRNSTVESWKNQGYWNLSFKNEQHWKNQGFYNMSFKSSSYQREFGYFNFSFGNTLSNKNLGYWNTSFKSTSLYRNLGFWNLSFKNTSVDTFKNLSIWNISFRNGSYDVVYVDDNAPVGWYNETHLHTIQQGVTTVSRFGTVYVWAGNYSNHVIINKTLSIIGNGSTSILHPAPFINNNAIYINDADWVNITGMNISGANRSVYVYSSDNCTVNNSILYSNQTAGVYSSNSKYGDYSDNNIRGNNSGIYLTGSSSHTIISNNTVYNINAQAILLSQQSENCTVVNNNISDVGSGIQCSANNNTIFNNTINVTTTGILIAYCKYVFCSNNTIRQVDSGGISLLDSNYSRIINNTVFGGLAGISLYTSSSYNWIYNNFIGSGGVLVTDEGTGNKWNYTKTLGTNIIGGPYLGGNYYSDNTGLHIGDGFSVPYTITGIIRDELPLVYYHWFNRPSFWNVSFGNILGWKNQGFYNVSFKNTPSQRDFGYWNVSFKNVLSWENMGFWNTSFKSGAYIRNFGFLNLSFRNSSASRYTDQGFYNVSFGNIQTWKQQGFFNVSFRNVTAGIDIYDWFPANGSGGIASHSAVYITINSSKGYTMNITWFGSTDNGSSWFFLGIDFNVSNGTYSTGFFNATVAYHRYDWRVWANDGHNNYNNDTLYYTCGVGGAGRGAMYEDGIYMIAVGLLVGFIIGPEIFGEMKKRRKRRR